MTLAITVGEYITSTVKNAREGLESCPAILSEGYLAGQVLVGNVQRSASQSTAVGCWMTSSFAGKGLAPLAMATALDWCLSEYGLRRVEINICPENAPSLRVTKKLGVCEEGLRRHYLYINGAWSDHRCFAVTLEEW